MKNRSATFRRLPSLIAAVAVATGASAAMADTMNSATRANPERAGSAATTSGTYGTTGSSARSSSQGSGSTAAQQGDGPSNSVYGNTGSAGSQGPSNDLTGTRGVSTTNYSDTANVRSSPTANMSSGSSDSATQGTGYGSTSYGTSRPTQSTAPVNTTTGEANFHDGRAPVRPGADAPQAADASGPKTRQQVRDEVLRARMTGQLLTTNPAIAWAPAHIDVNSYHGSTSMASREDVRREAREALHNPQSQNPSRDYRLGSPSVIPPATADVGNKAE